MKTNAIILKDIGGNTVSVSYDKSSGYVNMTFTSKNDGIITSIDLGDKTSKELADGILELLKQAP